MQLVRDSLLCEVRLTEDQGLQDQSSLGSPHSGSSDAMEGTYNGEWEPDVLSCASGVPEALRRKR